MIKIKPCNERSGSNNSCPLTDCERIVLGTAKDNCLKMIKRKRHLDRNRILLCGEGGEYFTTIA